MNAGRPPTTPRLTRRRLLQAGSAVGLVGLASRGRVVRELVRPVPLADSTSGNRWTVSVARPSDALRLELELVDVSLTVDGRIVPFGPDAQPRLKVTFPSQHTTEQVSTATPVATRAESLAAPPSVVVLDLGAGREYTLASLLSWEELVPLLDQRAETTDAGQVVDRDRPGADVTRLVVPEGLWLTPTDSSTARFQAVATPLLVSTPGPGIGTTTPTSDVFRARLGRDLGGGFVAGGTDVRAIWTPGFAWGMDITADGAPDPFPRAVSQDQLKQLVRAMSEYDDTTYPAHEPATAHRLELSSASGATFDVTGAWEGSGDVAAWEHHARTGRDVFVKVVSRGYLAPFGHAATVVTISERVFTTDTSGDVQAVLFQREFLSLAPSTQELPAALMPHGGREFPFVSATLTTGGLLEIDRRQIVLPGSDPVPTDLAFLGEAVGSGAPLRLTYTLDDRVPSNEAPVEATFPAVWVAASEAFDTSGGSVLDRVVGWLADDVTNDDRTVPMDGAPVGYTDELEPGSGRTTFATLRQVWRMVTPAAGVLASELEAVGWPAFLPELEVAAVQDAVLDAVTGTVGDIAERAVDVVLSADWLDEAADNAVAKVLDLVAPTTVAFEGVGQGIAAPVFGADNINQVIGFASDLLVPGEPFDPRDLLSFDDLPTLLGILPLDEVLDGLSDVVPPAPDLPGAPSIPGLTVTTETAEVAGVEVPVKLVATFSWSTPVGDFQVGGTDVLDTSPDSTLSLEAVTCITYDGAPPETSVDVVLDDFTIVAPPVVPLVEASFAEVRLTLRSGDGLTVVPSIREIRLVGLLTLLDVIRPLLDFGPSGLEVVETEDDIRASLEVSTPDINLGVLVVRSITVSAGVTVPIVLGRPVTTDFSIGTAEDPVTVVVLGYGGSFSMELEAAPAPGSFELLALSVSVVFEQSIDVVVAKGSLSASFGAFLEVTPSEVEGVPGLDAVLGGYVEVVGSLKVLGIATITVGASIELTYSTLTQILRGTATVFVEVDVKLVKKEVSITFEQEFSLGDGGARLAPGRAGEVARRAALAPGVRPGPGSTAGSTGGAGTFADRFDEPTWAAHCAAFA